MRASVLSAAVVAAGASALLAGAAQAHAHLHESAPAANSAGPAPSVLTLKFSEGLVARFSGVDVAGPGGPVAVKTAVAGATMTATPAKPLAPGAYTVKWHVVSTDTHKMKGDYAFTVK